MLLLDTYMQLNRREAATLTPMYVLLAAAHADCLMSLCLVMMVPFSSLDADASFATAFTQVGLPWGQYLVALGAVLG